MRIAVLVRRFPELSETFILNQITGLLDQGVDLEVFAWTPGDSEAVHPDVSAYALLGRTRYIHPRGSRLSRLGRTLSRLASSGAWRSPGFLRRSMDRRHRGGAGDSLFLLHAGAAFLRGEPHDLVHCQFGRLGLTALALREVGALPGRIVVSFRGSDLSRHRDTEGYDELFQVGNLFLPVCGAFRDRLISMGCDPGKIQVHHSGIDLRRFTWTPRYRQPGRPFRILSIARLVEKKGVEYGIRAVAELHRAGREVEYAIIGEGPLDRELRALVRELEIADRVRFLGPLDHDEVVSHLGEAHVLVAPSVTAASGDQEGIPNVLKEAMATGIPVVSTLHSGIPELVEDGVSGFLVEERNAPALEKRLAHLMDHPELWESMGRAGRERVEAEYDSVLLNRKLEGFYRGLLA